MKSGLAIDGFTWAAIGIVAFGALLRLYTIFAFSWDQDELYSALEARDLFHTDVPPGINARPLFFLLEHPLLTLLPRNPAVLRLLPFVFGIAGLWVTWLAARRHVGRVGGLVAVFLAATSTWHMEASGQARYYSLLYLCAALVLLWLPQAYDGERRAAFVGALMAMACGTLTHPSFEFPVAGMVLGVALVSRYGHLQSPWPSSAAWRWLWGPFIAFLVLFFASLQLAHRQSALRNSVGRGLVSTLRLVPAMVEWITPAVFGAAIVGVAFLLLSTRPAQRRLGVMCLLSLVITVAALFAMSFWTAVYATYATALLPVLFVTVGALAQLVARAATTSSREGVVAAGAIALLGFAIAPSTLSHLSDGTRFDYRSAYRQIEREGPDRPVATWPAILATEYAPNLKLLPLLPDSAYLDGLLTRHGDIWAVASVKRTGIALDDAGDVERWLAARCRRRGAYERPRFDYRLYRVELFRCVAAPDPAAVSPSR